MIFTRYFCCSQNLTWTSFSISKFPASKPAGTWRSFFSHFEFSSNCLLSEWWRDFVCWRWKSSRCHACRSSWHHQEVLQQQVQRRHGNRSDTKAITGSYTVIMQYSKPISDQMRLALFVNRALSRYCEVLVCKGPTNLRSQETSKYWFGKIEKS